MRVEGEIRIIIEDAGVPRTLVLALRGQEDAPAPASEPAPASADAPTATARAEFQDEFGAMEAQRARREHWIADPKTRARFWAWVGDLGLTDAEVHTALGVGSVYDFAGTKQDAYNRILAWSRRERGKGESQ